MYNKVSFISKILWFQWYRYSYRHILYEGGLVCRALCTVEKCQGESLFVSIALTEKIYMQDARITRLNKNAVNITLNNFIYLLLFIRRNVTK